MTSSQIPGIGLAPISTVNSSKALGSSEHPKQTASASTSQPDLEKQEEIREADELRNKLRAILDSKTRGPGNNHDVSSPAPASESGHQQDMASQHDELIANAQTPAATTRGIGRNNDNNLRTITSEAASESSAQLPMSSNPGSVEPGSQVLQTTQPPPTGSRADSETIASSGPQSTAPTAPNILRVNQSTIQQATSGAERPMPESRPQSRGQVVNDGVVERRLSDSDDTAEWLELTGYHDPFYRGMKLELLRQKAELLAIRDRIEHLETRLEEARSTGHPLNPSAFRDIDGGPPNGAHNDSTRRGLMGDTERLETRLERARSTGRPLHPSALRDTDERPPNGAHNDSTHRGLMGDTERLRRRDSPAEDTEQERARKRPRTENTFGRAAAPANFTRYPTTNLTQEQSSRNQQNAFRRIHYRGSHWRPHDGPSFASSGHVVPVRATGQRGAAFGSQYSRARESHQRRQ